MKVQKKGSEKRDSERLDLSFQISLPSQEGKTINISASGVYFEVMSDDPDRFAPGTILPVKISASATTPGLEERDIELYGRGIVIRRDIRDTASHGNMLRVAMEFRERLSIVSDES